jgi:hypothetical protein
MMMLLPSSSGMDSTSCMEMTMSMNLPHDVQGDVSDAQVTEPPGRLDAPEGWPLTLQVAITFWIVTGAVLSFAMMGGAGWLLALIPIAVDYVVYLKTDRGLIVELLSDSSWNRPAGTPSLYAPGESISCMWPTFKKDKEAQTRVRDLNIAEMLRVARVEVALLFIALRKVRGQLARRISEVKLRFFPTHKDIVQAPQVVEGARPIHPALSSVDSATWRNAA